MATWMAFLLQVAIFMCKIGGKMQIIALEIVY